MISASLIKYKLILSMFWSKYDFMFSSIRQKLKSDN